MTIRFLIAAACLSLAAPTIAAAQTQPTATQTLSLGELEQRLAADGFRIIEIERYPNSVEVKGFDRAGQCTEMYLDPRTGDVLRSERDHDCDRTDSEDDHHDRRRGGS
jgi:hypothetical protein